MKTCDDMKAALIDLIFGEPTADAEMRLNQHLATCPSCRDEERRLLDLRQGLRDEEGTPNPELREQIRAALPSRRGPRAFGLLSRPIPAYLAAAACLVVALIVWALSRESRPGQVSPEAPGRPVAVTLASRVLPFTPAGSYDTGVRRAESPGSRRDSSLRGRRLHSDSLGT